MALTVMSDVLNRTVEIQISNDTRNITLTNPRVHLHHGHSSFPPRPSVLPGHEDSCKFIGPRITGCEGILTYEAESFTVAIYFCNPLHYYMNPIAVGLEISLRKTHLQLKPANIFAQMRNRRDATYEGCQADRVTVGKSQEAARVSASHVCVMATMSNDRRAIIKVVVEEREGSGR